MSSFSLIQQKLEEFIKKYYTSELIKGTIFFFAAGFLYFLLTLLIEYFLWLSPTGRTILFWSFVLVEFCLFMRFIAFTLLKLFSLQQGITNEQAAQIIGDHFPEVNDKLLNVLQLNQNQRESDLLAASIDQKALQMQSVVFKKAINFQKNLKYLVFAAVPILVFGAVSVLGEKDLFSSSYKRVVNYDTAYTPPAPFSFFLLNEELSAIQNQPFTLKIRAKGSAIPQDASIVYNDQNYFLKQTAPGIFEYTFLQPSTAIDFKLTANDVNSKNYTLEVVKTPSLVSFQLFLNYPNYTGKKDQTLNSTGNTILPEGTKVQWLVNTQNTTHVGLKTKDTTYSFTSNQQQHQFDKTIYNTLDYAITTSNNSLQEYENLSFTIRVIKDEFPEISLQSKQDSLSGQQTYFLGQVSDDYGFSKLQLVYYPQAQQDLKTTLPISVNNTTLDQFTHTFPGQLDLPQDVEYEYFFEIFDNDAVNNYKSSRSGYYSYRKPSQDELQTQQLQNQENAIKSMDAALQELKNQDKRLEQLEQLQKEKESLNWNDKKKLEDVVRRQKEQEKMMQQFSKQLQESLEKFQPENKEKDPFKQQLEKRLQENQEQLKENEKLLQELEELQDKISQEALTEKLEKAANKNKNQEKNLEQLIELTKQYYVTKKSEKLSEELFKLGVEQRKLAEKQEQQNTKQAQEKINKKFEKYKQELEELKKENETLKSPMKLPQDKVGEKEVDRQQQQATQKLEKQNKAGAKQNQKKAGKKMQEMGQQMMMALSGSQGEQIEEDLAMLRQILDNLIVFSFRQEALMEDFKLTQYGNPLFGKRLNIQNDLKQNFQHIDDSLFSLSLRQPAIGQKINESITQVHYNLKKAMERLAENQIPKGVGSQQYTVTATNNLANLLTNLLTSMQQQQMGQGSGSGKQGMPKPGQGQGEGFQLPDIIEKQKSLAEKMQEGMGEKGKEGKEGEQGEGEGEGKEEGEGQGSGEGQGQRDGGNGSPGNQPNASPTNQSENNDAELFEIYKQQQQLRQDLEDRLSKLGLEGLGGQLIKKMQGIEQQLLDKGFNRGTLEKMLNLQYELLKLKEADLKQGQESRRESISNRKTYTNTTGLSADQIKKYFNTTEILNREALPLRQEYKEKVQSYFKKNND